MKQNSLVNFETRLKNKKRGQVIFYSSHALRGISMGSSLHLAYLSVWGEVFMAYDDVTMVIIKRSDFQSDSGN